MHSDTTMCRIREWFPTALKARIRANALDPYGLFELRTRMGEERGKRMTFECSKHKCTARLYLKEVHPDEHGNSWGLHGCIAHQHPPPRDKLDIIFETLGDAQNFFYEHLNGIYAKTKRKADYMILACRRKFLKTEGYHPCDSKFSIHPSFPRSSETTFSITGNFYHSHKDEPKFHRSFKYMKDRKFLDRICTKSKDI